MDILLSETALFGSSDGPRASKRRDPRLLQVGEPLQVICSGSPSRSSSGQESGCCCAVRQSAGNSDGRATRIPFACRRGWTTAESAARAPSVRSEMADGHRALDLGVARHGRPPRPARQSPRAAPAHAAYRQACSASLRAPGRQTGWF